MQYSKTAAILLTAVLWTGCEPSQPTLTPTGNDTGSAPVVNNNTPDAGVTKTPDQTPPSSGLTDFFGAGNFATLTVPVPDGKPEVLSIKTLDVKVSVIGRMARTEVTQVFHNHTSRRTEGSYEFTLPEGAAISRLAMDVEGKMMEGELVERERARQIYESIVRAQKDPALLEWQGGNRFKTQIFPIEAQSDKKVVLAYEQVLPRDKSGAAYRYNMPNLTGQPGGSNIGGFSFTFLSEDSQSISVQGYPAKVEQRQPGGKVAFQAKAFRPTGPMEVRFQPPGRGEPSIRYATRKGERFFMIDFIPGLPASSEGASPALVLAMDTSAGIGKIELGRAVKAAKALLDTVPKGTQLKIVHGDIKVRNCGEAALTPDAAKTCLDGLEAGGATDLQALLLAAAGAQAEGSASVVVFTDGSASLGELDGDLMVANVKRAVEGREVALHTVAIGHAPDTDFLAGLSSQARGHAARMTPADTPADLAGVLGALIREPLLTDITVETVEGTVEGLVPHKSLNLARGAAMAVMGRLDKGAAKVRVRGQWRGQTVEKTFSLSAPDGEGDRMMVNFWARQVIEEMQDKGVKRDKVVATSQEYGVMSRYTSFLVLENDEAYKRFKIDRRKEKERQQQEAQKTANLKKGQGNLQDMLGGRKDSKIAAGEEGKFGDPDNDDDSPEEEEEMAEVDKEMADEKVAADPAPQAEMEPAKAEAPRRMDRANERARQPSTAAPSVDGYVQGLGGMGTAGRGGGGGGKDFGGAKAKKGRPGVYGNGRFNWQADRIKALETRKNALSPQEQVELLDLYSNSNKTAQARAFLKQCLAKVPAEKRDEETLRLLASANSQNLLSREFLAAARKRITQPNPPESVLRGLWNHLMAKGDTKALVKEFGAIKMIPTTAANFLQQLIRQGKIDVAETLFAAWQASGQYTGGELYQILTNNRQIAKAMPKALGSVSLKLVQEGDSRPEVIADLANTATKETVDVAAPLVLSQCKKEDADLTQCAAWLGKLSANADVKAFLSTLHSRRLEAINKARQQDMGNPKLIEEGARLLSEIGENEAAARLRSELVEFAPHDYAARTRYALSLVKTKDIKGGCDQYAAAVQLNPSERDTFRTMMQLRRSYDKEAEAIRSCIVDGVSKLPVQRAVSLILTWEDPRADVDLHIDEQGGEHVYYQHRESELGGLLYYDITDGFGPEIYVLGSGPGGEYKLSLVYYSGTAKDLRGTLTILRNAGTPQETRENRQFVLPSAGDSTRVPIGVFRL